MLQPRRGLWVAFGLSAFLLGVATGAVLALRPELLLPVVMTGVGVVVSCILGLWIVRRVRTRQLVGYQDPGRDEGGGLAGVREPRSPHPPEDEGAVALLPPGASGHGRSELAS